MGEGTKARMKIHRNQFVLSCLRAFTPSRFTIREVPFSWGKDTATAFSGLSRSGPLRGFSENLQTSLVARLVFSEKTLTIRAVAVLFAQKRELSRLIHFKQNAMQKVIFKKTALTVILILLLAVCFSVLSKAGIQPLMAAIAILCLKGLIRFVYRLTVMLVSIAIVISLILFLICI